MHRRLQNRTEYLRRAELRFEKAKGRYEQAIKKTLAIGCTVYWDHGKIPMKGTVRNVSDDRVCVDLPSGKRMWIHTPRLTFVH